MMADTESRAVGHVFEEREYLRYGTVIGIDEAGRGPWAGPVVAAAVIFDERQAISLSGCVRDSKAMTRKQREYAFERLSSEVRFGVGIADASEITALNILRATFLAMGRATAALGAVPGYALADGSIYPADDLPCPGHAVIKGDGHLFSIAAASVIAKVTRDRIMGELAERYPCYGWEDNSGYGTARHRAAMERYGITPQHRRTFKPVREILRLRGEL